MLGLRSGEAVWGRNLRLNPQHSPTTLFQIPVFLLLPAAAFVMGFSYYQRADVIYAGHEMSSRVAGVVGKNAVL